MTGGLNAQFAPFDATRKPHPAVLAATQQMLSMRIEEHEFFALATGRRDMLQLWVSQELFVTNPFSELLLGLARRVANVHLRSLVVLVATGEHSSVRHGVATRSHPWLLWQLALKMGLAPEEAVELRGTAWFRETLRDHCSRSDVAAVGALGVGNEALLVPEYGRMLTVFESTWPEVNASHFLDANIREDATHAQLMEQLASVLLYEGASENEYLVAANAAVRARIEYYDMLATFAK